MKNRTMLLLFLLMQLLITGCSIRDTSSPESDTIVEETTVKDSIILSQNKQPDEMTELEVSVWTTYWDMDLYQEELQVIENKIDNLLYFAAYFDSNNQIFIPDETLQTKELTEKLYEPGKYTRYLTFVNDKILEDGSSSLKDSELLDQLFVNSESRQKLAKQMILLAVEHGFDGIEVDFEALKDDQERWNHFILFLDELKKQAGEQSLLIRVLFEPAAPLENFQFPEGLDYIMMCYNLYGYGTEPGPKANKDFLNEMAEKMEILPGEPGFAFSTGGFDYSDNGDVKALREIDAFLLSEDVGVNIRRDDNSQNIVFDYTDEKGVDHQVWYADATTLQYWTDIIKEQGYKKISIWRMGGLHTFF